MPLSRRVLSWLLFRHSLADKQWQSHVREQFAGKEVSPPEALSQWLQQQRGYAISTTHWPLMLLFAGIGALSLVGVCSYSGAAPVNLWLLLGLFAFVPLIMTLLAGLAWRNSRQPSQPLPILGQLAFRSLLSRTEEWRLDTALFKPWLLWQLQRLAISFQLGVIAGFLLLALFQDLAFAWSSTLVDRGGWMDDLLVWLSIPWSWLLAAPSEELLVNSHFY
ncbi:MAG: DUF2868 domain-containing protein, partial [Porticoccaceae bacterium]|nr:DUF2868 domain-containing protein [Porticoccaceae bacterium]